MARTASGQILFAVLLIILGLLFLAGNLGWIVFSWRLVWPILLIILGVWMVFRAFMPGQFDGEGWPGIGDYRPDYANKEVRRVALNHGMGDFDLDLTRATIPEGESQIRVSDGLGDLMVVVPRDIAVRAEASAGLGDVFVLGKRSDGFSPRAVFQSDDYDQATRKLNIQASVGLGSAKVVRAG